jgi:hypothetical protein
LSTQFSGFIIGLPIGVPEPLAEARPRSPVTNSPDARGVETPVLMPMNAREWSQ